MKVTETKLPGVVILEPNVYPDERGLRKRNINLNMHKMPVVGGAPLP